MSGPKTSHYTLTAEQRRILEEQRRVKMERELLAKQQGDIRSVIAEADRMIEQMEPLCVEVCADTTVLMLAKKRRESAVNALSLASSASDKDGSVQLRKMNRDIRTAARELSFAAKALTAEYSSADKAFRDRQADRIDAGFDFSFDVVGDTFHVGNIPFMKKIQSVLNELSELSISDEQKVRLAAIQAKLKEIDDPDFLKNFYTMTVVPFEKECRAYHAAYTDFGEEYEHKLYIYIANAQKIGIAPEHIPSSTDAIAILDTKLKETEAIIRQQEEQAYISQCVDEAMEEMGYSVVGNREVVRRNGKHFRNELYLFDEGTAVNVTYSSDGQITMELGGIGMEDRLPDEAESASLASDMQAFCDDYYEIEQRLLKKGIVTRRISILPPDAQYAQIINVSDYNLSAALSEYDATGARKPAAKDKSRRIGES
ncbi:MAG: hypothetical protein LUG47_04605 [Clostridiales bacterium]|nr:hypothetical protein [Clostridiales bacterium]